MKKQLILVAILSVLALAGSVYAYMFWRTDPQKAAFVPAYVACQVTDGENVVVKNTGNIPAYIRVRMVTYWVDGDGKVAPKTPPELSITAINGWVTGTDHTYYYPVPVGPEASTLALLASSVVLTEEGEYKQCVDVFAEAIQADPTIAVVEAWDVMVSGSAIMGEKT